MSSSEPSNLSTSKTAELKIRLLEAEVNKLKAEEEEIRLRTKEVKNRQSSPWWKTPTFLQIVLTSLASVTILAFYINYALEPLRNKKVLESEIQNLKLEKKNLEDLEQLIKDKKQIQEQLQKDNDRLKAEWKNLKKENTDLIAKNQQLGREKEATQAMMNAQRIQSNINAVDSRAQTASKKGIVYIQVPLESVKSEAGRLQEFLRKQGYVAPGIEVVGINVSPKNSQIRYFYKEQEESAKQLSGMLDGFGLKGFNPTLIPGYEGKASRELLEIWYGRTYR
jgi:flagellar biosynthesis/type III secretory pathway chaperone